MSAAAQGFSSAAVDIGGTFTDIVAFDESGRLLIDKLLTSLPDQSIAAVQGLENALGTLEPTAVIKHGTTAVINAVLERNGARVGLVATKGFRDAIEIGRGNRTRPYDLFFRHPEPLVPRYLRFEVEERIGADGSVVRELDREGLQAVARELLDEGVEAVAISFVNSYVDPAHERLALETLAEAMPGVFVTCGADLSREWREFERTSTVILNAYVGPMADVYLTSLRTRLGASGFDGDLLLMQSNGGVFSVDDAAQQPIRLLESGPVAGIIGAAELGAELGFDDILAFDMGGTTAKAAVVRGGVPVVESRYYVGGYEDGYPLQVPVVDVVEIGTGGGSIAWLDEVGALQVGPRSAGSVPGPACYGAGGSEPTVTDANLHLGRLDAANFLGGSMALHPDLAQKALSGSQASQLELDATELANGIITIATLAMANALRRVTVERGHDPRDFAMVAYGGAGPLHASAVARELGVRRLLIPPMPGHFSAWGMLQAPIRKDFSRTQVARLDDERAVPQLEALCAALLEDSASWRESLAVAPTLEYVAEARYTGQEHTIQVALHTGGTLNMADFGERFHAAYATRYGHAAPDEVIEIVHVRLVATAAETVVVPSPGSTYDDAPRRDPSSRSVYFHEHGWVQTPVHARAGLAVGAELDGPCVIEEHASTTIVDHGARVLVREGGTLQIEFEGKA